MSSRVELATDRQIAEDYRVLGLELGAPLGEAKRAFRRLIKRWHPDVTEEPLERALAETRRLYQAFGRLRTLSAREVETLARRRRAVEGRRVGSRTVRPGRDLLGALAMSRRQASAGTRWQLRIATCRGCGGWGDAAGRELSVCPGCDGLGFRRSGEEGWNLAALCPSCRGHGCQTETPCPRCRGRGESGFYVVRCAVPAFRLGQVAYRWLPGQGHPGLGGGPPGDLYLRITVHDERSNRGGRR